MIRLRKEHYAGQENDLWIGDWGFWNEELRMKIEELTGKYK